MSRILIMLTNYRAIQKPMWNYPTETVYYREASSVNPLLSVRIPLLALNSEDDPVSSMPTRHSCTQSKLTLIS
jgi:predicted alpha/beta-fold hydrolase